MYDVYNIFHMPSYTLVRVYHVNISYTTKRGNKKKRTFEIKVADDNSITPDLKYQVQRWQDQLEKRTPYRVYDNVKILSYTEVDRYLLKL